MVRNLRCRDARRHRGGWLDGIRCGCAEGGRRPMRQLGFVAGPIGRLRWISTPKPGIAHRGRSHPGHRRDPAGGDLRQRRISGSASAGCVFFPPSSKGAPIRIISGSATGNAGFRLLQGGTCPSRPSRTPPNRPPSPIRPMARPPTPWCSVSSANSVSRASSATGGPAATLTCGIVGTGRHRLDLAAARLRHARRRPHSRIFARANGRAESQGPGPSA